MTADLQVVGPQAAIRRRVASGGTAIRQGESIDSQATASSGAASANVYALTNADAPIIGTDRWGGVPLENSINAAAGTTNAQEIHCACPAIGVGQVRGRAETVGNVDTDSELINITGDYVLMDYNATGATDGGELYTIHDDASADTSGFEIVGGDISLNRLYCTVAATVYRFDVS